MHRRFVQRVMVAVIFMPAASPAFAQEDIEPRTVGARGRITIGLAAFIDQFASAE